jgi:hypothetical protein
MATRTLARTATRRSPKKPAVEPFRTALTFDA